MESFFGTLKTELVHQCDYPDRDTARRELFAYIRLLQSAADPLRYRLHHPGAGRPENRITWCPLFRGKVSQHAHHFRRQRRQRRRGPGVVRPAAPAASPPLRSARGLGVAFVNDAPVRPSPVTAPLPACLRAIFSLPTPAFYSP